MPIDTGLWTVWGTGTQDESGGTLNQTPSGVAGQYIGIYSNATFDLTNKEVQAQIAQLPSSATGVQAVFRVEIDANNAVTMCYSDGQLLCQHQIASTMTNVSLQAWTANTLAFRINFDNTQSLVWFDIYVAGSGWVNKFYEALPIATTALRISIATGCYATVGSPGTTKWESTGLPIVRNLVASSAGTATAAGATSRRRALTGSSTGAATAAATIRRGKSVGSVSSAGVATAASTPSRRRSLGSRTTAGVATAAATISKTSGAPPEDVYGDLIRGEPSLTVYWPMHEAAGAGLINDEVGSTDLTIFSGVTQGVASGIPGDSSPTSIRLDGTVNSRVMNTNPTDIVALATTNFTFEWWFFQTAADNAANQSWGAPFFEFGDGASNIGLNAWNYDSLTKFYVGLTPTQAMSAAGVTTTDAWQHYAVVRNGLNGILYVDGVEVVRVTDVGTTQILNWRFQLGFRETPDYGGQYLYRRGWFTQVAVYDAALSPLTIATHHAVGMGEELPQPSPTEWQSIQGEVPNPAGADEYGYNAIAVDAFTPDTVYLGTNHQGIWRSTDAGLTWAYRSTGTGSSQLLGGGNWTLAVDPFNGAIYTTVGHGAQGVWKSTDGGVNWVDTFNSTISTLVGTNDIYTISADPHLEDHLLVTFHYYWTNPVPDSGSGICESFDGGATWTAHFPPAGSAWGAGNGVWFGNDSNTWVFGSQNDGFWITHDGGDTWAQWTALTMAHGATHALTRTPSGVLLVAVDQTVFRSTDNGYTWVNVGTGLSGGYFQAVASDGVNMFTAAAFPTNGDNGDHPWLSKAVLASAGTAWTTFGPAPMSAEGQRNGPVQAAFDTVTGVIYTANWRGGVWRLQGTPPEPGALPPVTATGGAVASAAISGGSTPATDFLTDTFTDADGTNIGAHTPTTGGAWVVQMWNPEDGLEIGIYSNTLTCEPFGQRHALNLATPPAADYEVQAQIKCNGSDDNKVGVRLRGQNAAGFNPPSYVAMFDAQVMTWKLLGWDGGQVERGTWADSGFTTGVTRSVRLKATGSLLEVYVDSTLRISATDTGLSATGYAGVWMEGGGRYVYVLDNIRAGGEEEVGPGYKDLSGSSAGQATCAGAISGGAVAPPGAYELVAQVRGRSPGSPFGTLFTTTDIDTTGANLLLACYVHNENPPPVLSDSKGNTWLEGVSNTAFWGARIYYVKAAGISVGPGHTFKLEVPGSPDATFFGNLQVYAFKGADANPLDDTNQETSFGTTTLQPGPVDPTTDGQLIITVLNHNRSVAPTINAGFTTPYGYVEGDYFGYLGAHSSYLLQPTAATSDPTWTGTDGSYYGAIASFKAGVAGGPIYKNLSGTSNGVASSPLLEPSRQRPLVATASASSTTTASLSRKRRIAAAAQANGTATTTASVARRVPLGVRTSAGVATTSAVASRQRRLASVQSAGIATTTAAPARRRALNALSQGSASVLALLTKSSPTVPPVSITGAATTTAQASRRRRVGPVSANGLATVSGTASKVTPTVTPAPANGLATATALLSRRRTPGLVSSVGLASTTATASRRRPLAALSAGTSSTVAAVGRRRTLTAVSSAGVATTAGRLTKPLAAILSAGKATVVGFAYKVTPQVPPVLSAGRATVTGSVGNRRLLGTISSAGKATTTATTTRKRSLSVASLGVASTTATASRQRRLAPVATAGVASPTAAPARRRPLLASTAGVATTTAVLAGGALRVTSAGLATTTAQVAARRRLAGTSAAASTTSASIVRKRSLGSRSTLGQATTTAVLSKTRATISGTSAGKTTVTAVPSRRRTLAGSTSAGQATVSVTLIKGRARDLVAASTGTSSTLGKTTARRWIGLITIVVGTSSSSSSLKVKRSLSGTSAGRTIAAGSLGVTIGQVQVFWNTPGEQFVFAPTPGLAEVTWGVESDQFMPGEVSV